MNETKKARSSNIEMLRVVAMFMIVLFHITTHCIVPQLNNAGTPWSPISRSPSSIRDYSCSIG